MTRPGPDRTRRDRAVIMARGRGRRMGQPKGSLRLTPTGPTFLERVAGLYAEVGFPVDVVTCRRDAAVYRKLLAGADGPALTVGPDGGDTALTLLTAWRSWRERRLACTHVWAHPVDLPLVRPETLRRLREVSRERPEAVLRPAFAGVPGHPVLLPAPVMDRLAGEPTWLGQPLRRFLASAAAEGRIDEPAWIECGDAGVVRDFDQPADLTRERPEERGTS